MKLPVLSIKKIEIGKKELPSQFNEPIRPDLIRRAVLAGQSNRRQPYGAYIMAGKRASAEISRRRRKYRGSYGHGISRVPRKIVSRRGTRMNWVGAFAPGTVGGRRAHPPKATKKWTLKINRKERRKAIRSALAATLIKELVERRGHIIPPNYPFIIETKIESLDKTKLIKEVLATIGLKEEIERVAEKRIRAGKGKMRGRKYKRKKGPLIIVSGKCSLEKAAGNIPGVEVVKAENLNAELLAPGSESGRLTILTDKAIDKIASENLFTDSIIHPKEEAKK